MIQTLRSKITILRHAYEIYPKQKDKHDTPNGKLIKVMLKEHSSNIGFKLHNNLHPTQSKCPTKVSDSQKKEALQDLLVDFLKLKNNSGVLPLKGLSRPKSFPVATCLLIHLPKLHN